MPDGMALALLVAFVVVVALVEVVSAALPVLIVITFVPPEQRSDLAKLLATIDSTRRLRLWRALSAAVAARRRGMCGIR